MSLLGRSGLTIDPRIPTMPGRSTSGFHGPGRHVFFNFNSPTRAVRSSVNRMKGELHSTQKRL